MLNKTITTATVLGLVMGMTSMVHTADAKDKGFYGRFDTGYSKFSGSAGTGGGGILSGGVGYRFSKNFRADTTLGHHGGSVTEKGTINGASYSGTASGSSLTGMVNAYVDLRTYEKITPYFGGGIGFSRNKLNTVTAKIAGLAGTSRVSGATETSLAWKLAAGASLDLGSGWVADAGYNYIDLGKFSTGTTATIAGVNTPIKKISADAAAHEFRIGVRFDF